MRFVNISNHPIEKWDAAQKREAGLENGWEGIDLPFPPVDPSANEIAVLSEARKLAIAVFEYGSPTEVEVMVQGEMNLTFTLVTMLLEAGYRVFAATSRREVADKGNGTKEVLFKFQQFRPYNIGYPRLNKDSRLAMLIEHRRASNINNIAAIW